MQHTKLCTSRRSVADEAKTKNLLYGSPENSHVGALEEGRIAPANRSVVRSKPLIDTANSRRVWRYLPAQRQRSRLALSLAEREEISRSLAIGHPIRQIARSLGRAPSTISREINRNGGQTSYRANCADAAAWKRSHRPKNCKLVDNPGLARIVAGKLQLQWSPEQIAGWLKYIFPEKKDYQVSHETIHRSLFIQARGALKKELLTHLRRSRTMRRSRHHTQKTDNHGRIKDTVSISERPAMVEDRAVPGHWEGDLVFGDRNSQIATLVERHTRYVMLVKIASKDTETVINALIENARQLPQELYQSLTWDRGKEMADHKRFTMATDIDVYFAIRTALGNGAAMKIQMGYCANTSPKESMSQRTRRPNSMK